MRSLLGQVLNRAPISFAPRSTGAGISLLPGSQRNDAEAQMRAYGGVGTLFAIVSRTSNACAQVDWRLWRKARSGRKEDRTEVTGHVALDLWNQPNPYMPRQEFVESFQQHVDLTGEGWWVVGRADRLSPMPLELWPVRPDRMAPVPHPTEFLSGYVYRGPDGEKVPLDTDQVIMLRMPNPLDPYRGLGPVQTLLVDLDSERYSAEWNRNFFLNGAEPGGLVEVPDHLSDPEFDELRDRWNTQHKGVSNAHRVAILERGKWVERKFSMRDLQFAELRRVSREIIREAFGFPKPLLGAVDDVNRANADAAEVMFARWLVVPRLERIKAALNVDLLGLFGVADTLEFDYDNPVPENAEQEVADRDSRVAAVVALAGAGFDGQTAAEAYELPDELVWSEPEPEPAPPPAAGAPPEGMEGMGEAVEAAVRRALGAEPQGHVHRNRRPRRVLASDQDDQLAIVQADWEQQLDQLLADWAPITAGWTDDLASQIRDAVDADDMAALAGMSLDTDEAAELVAAAMVAMGALAAERMADEARSQGVETDTGEVDATVLGDYGSAVVALLASGLAAAAGREALRVRGPDATGQSVAQQVTDFLSGLSDRPLRDQLGGALSNAQNTGRIATLRLAPEAAYYANETLDTNTCKYCREVDGRWLGNSLADVERTYPNGGYTECLGRERCRGTVTAVWRPEQVGDE